MSKKPPIGANWLNAKLDRLAQLGAVLPSFRLSIPETKGYLHPSGFLKDALIDGLAKINSHILETTGQNAPQWNTLIASVVHQPKIWERLLNVKEEQIQVEDFKRELDTKSNELSAKQADRSIRQRCGGILPCASCVRGFPDDYFKSHVEKYFRQQIASYGDARSAQKHHTKSRTCNPYCQLVDLPSHKRPFNKTA